MSGSARALMTGERAAGIVGAMHNSLSLTAVGAAIAWLALAVIHATHGTFDDQLTTTVDYLNDISFTIALVCTAGGLVVLRRGHANPRWALEGAVAGALLVAVGVVAGLVLGHSPSWFAAVGVPGNLLLLVSTIRLARAMWREREWQRWIAIGIGLTVPCGVVLAEIGTSAVLALVWAYVAGRLLAAAPAEPARAV